VGLQDASAGVVDWRVFDVLNRLRFLFPGEEPLLRVLVLAIVRILHHGLRLRRHFPPFLVIDYQ
jgi:hypothetical protein